MALTKFEVGQPFSGPVPAREGPIMELWHDGLVVLIQMPGCSRDERRAFRKGFKRYAYFESSTGVPVAVWVFDFPKPHGPIDCNFNARLAPVVYLDRYMDIREGIKNAVTFYLLDGNILQGMKYVGLDHEAVKLFHETIRKQRDMVYSPEDFNRYLSGLFNFSTDELLSMGKVFRHARAK